MSTTDLELNETSAAGDTVVRFPRPTGRSSAATIAAGEAVMGFVGSAADSPARSVATRQRARSHRLRHVLQGRDATFRRTLAVADLMAAVLALELTGVLSGGERTVLSLATAPLIVFVAKLIGRYDHDEVVVRKSTLDEVPMLLVLAGAFALAWALVTTAASVPEKADTIIGLWAAGSGLLIVLRTGARMLAGSLARPERVLIVGEPSVHERLAKMLSSDPQTRVEVVGFLTLDHRGPNGDGHVDPLSGLRLDELDAAVRRYEADRVFVGSAGADEAILEAVSRSLAVGVKVSIVPRVLEVVGRAVEFDAVGGMTVLGARRPTLTRSSKALKRLLDVVVALCALLVLAPLGALIALAIRLDSPGPILFRQRRIGRNGEHFLLFKFRSMIPDAAGQRAVLEQYNESSGTFKLSNDPRVTRVGRLLRRTSLDELPQLLNVLMGEMSLVGPRPLVPSEDEMVDGRYRSRLDLAPGMTGPWQVLGPHRPPLAEMVKTDYLYATNWSLWTDVKIILRTVAHVAARRGL